MSHGDKLTAVLLAGIPFFSTGIGGLAAIRFRSRMNILLGFSSGAVLGVVFFDLLPTVFSQRAATATLMLPAAAGFLLFHVLERHSHGHGGRHEHAEATQELGIWSAAGLSAHSFIDGIAIGLGFQVASKLGVLIALAVIAHDFADGLNTVTVVLAHKNPLRRAAIWLLLDMIAPVLGAIFSVFLPVTESVLPGLLAFFCGSFLYIGASDLLPEAREHASPWLWIATAAGMAFLFVIGVELPR